MISRANRLKDVKEYYFSKKLREVGQLQAAGKPIISLGIGSPDLDPPTEVIEAITAAMSDPMAHAYKRLPRNSRIKSGHGEFLQESF